MNKKKNKLKTSTNKEILAISRFLVFLILIVFIIRLFQLQILDAFNYRDKGNNISQIGRVVEPKRGEIVDRNGKVIAVSNEVDSLYLLQATTEDKSKEAELLISDDVNFSKLSLEERDRYLRDASLPIYKLSEIDRVAQILSITSDEIIKQIDTGREAFIYRALTKSQKEQIEALNLPYLQIMKINDRNYPNNELFSSVVGFIDQDGSPNGGLESYYDKELRGTKGYSEFYKAIQGTEIPFINNQKISSVDGHNLKTTLNVDLQNIVSKYMREVVSDKTPMNAIAILSDPNTGEILAMESYPTFNPNSPRDLSSEIDKKYLKYLEQDKHTEYMLSKWNNKAVSMKYDPGSVYKMATAAIVLEADNNLKNTVFTDNGYIELAPGVVIRSWRYWNPHGPQNLKEGFKNSSNPIFVQFARAIGKEKYIEYAKAFNFGKKSGIDLPREVEGFYPKDANISDVDFGTLSYGHYLNVNATQMVASMNSLVNGGKYYKPYVVSEIYDNNGDSIKKIENEYISNVVSEETSKEMLEYLEYAADAYGLNTNENIKIGAKTGTTVKYKTESIFPKETFGDEGSVIATIYSVYPASNPKYSLYLMFDEPLNIKYSSDITVGIAKKILTDIAQLENSVPKDVKDISEYLEVPDLTGKTVEEAIKIAEDLSLELESSQEIGRFHIVESQYPEKGNKITEGMPIKITTENKIKVPDVTGYEVNELIELFKINKIKYKILGEGTVVDSQSIQAQEIIDINTTVEITTKEK